MARGLFFRSSSESGFPRKGDPVESRPEFSHLGFRLAEADCTNPFHDTPYVLRRESEGRTSPPGAIIDLCGTLNALNPEL